MSAYRNKPQAVIFQPDLKNKVAIVTGAGRGIGQAVALAFARHGAKLVLAARTTSELHRNLELEDALVQRGKSKDAELIRRLSGLIEIRTVHQEAPLGSADAIRSACSLVGNEPFAVILPDVLIDAPIPCTRQLISCYERHPGWHHCNTHYRSRRSGSLRSTGCRTASRRWRRAYTARR